MSALQPIAFEKLDFAAPSAALGPFFPGSRSSDPACGLSAWDAATKRVVDVILASLVLCVVGLPMLAVAAIMWLQGDGPALFRQQRIGLGGEPFTLLKFRTMRADAAEAEGQCRQATRDDPRVTRLGRLLRRTSFDEWPQLLNVLAGTMSLVGPRPHAPGTCAAGRRFETITARYDQRHCVKPGITGLAQVRGWRGETDTVEKLLRRVDSDLEYIETWSLWQDLLIIGRTIIAVLLMRNAY